MVVLWSIQTRRVITGGQIGSRYFGARSFWRVQPIQLYGNNGDGSDLGTYLYSRMYYICTACCLSKMYFVYLPFLM